MERARVGFWIIPSYFFFHHHRIYSSVQHIHSHTHSPTNSLTHSPTHIPPLLRKRKSSFYTFPPTFLSWLRFFLLKQKAGEENDGGGTWGFFFIWELRRGWFDRGRKKGKKMRVLWSIWHFKKKKTFESVNLKKTKFQVPEPIFSRKKVVEKKNFTWKRPPFQNKIHI